MYNCVSLPIWDKQAEARVARLVNGARAKRRRERERETCGWGGRGSMSMRRLDVTELTSQDSHLENQRPAPSALLSHCFPIALFLSALKTGSLFDTFSWIKVPFCFLNVAVVEFLVLFVGIMTCEIAVTFECPCGKDDFLGMHLYCLSTLFLKSIVGETQMERCPGASPPFFGKKSPDSVKWAMMTYVDAGLFISL